MYRVEICDNERGSAICLERILKEKLNQAVIRVVSEEHLQAEIKADAMRPDILFVSVGLQSKSGVTLATQLQLLDPMIRVIFLAGKQDDVSNIFEAEPTGLLMKPFQKEKVYRALTKAFQGLEEDSTEFLQLKNREHLLRVRIQEIRYIESEKRYLKIYKKEADERVRMKLSELEVMLPDYFVRCHQSYLVNLHAIVQVTEHSLIFDDGKTVPISRSRRQQTRERVAEFFKEKK